MGRTWHRRTPEFKRMVVETVLRGEQTQEEVCSTYGVRRQQVIEWKKQYQQQGVEVGMQEQETKAQEQATGATREAASALPTSKQRRIEELERQCGRLLVENELLKKLLGRAGSKIDMP